MQAVRNQASPFSLIGREGIVTPQGGLSVAAGHGGDDAQLIFVANRAVQAIEIPDVFAIEVDIHEVPQITRLIDQPLPHAGVRRFERIDNGTDRCTVRIDCRFAIRQFPEGRWDFYSC